MPKILIAEDDDNDMLMMSMALEDAGYQVVQASDGKKALQKLKNESFMAVVSDIHMPEMNGVELAQACMKDYPDLPFYAVSSLADTFYSEMMEAFGARQVFVKSVDYIDLLDALSQIPE